MKYKENIPLENEKLRENVKGKLTELHRVLWDKNISLFFIPSAKLKEVVLRGIDPKIQGLPDGMKTLILEGKGVAIQKRLVYELLSGTLDEKNSFILNNGEIRVTQNNKTVLDLGKK